jgi:hypothetical protein
MTSTLALADMLEELLLEFRETLSGEIAGLEKSLDEKKAPASIRVKAY